MKNRVFVRLTDKLFMGFLPPIRKALKECDIRDVFKNTAPYYTDIEFFGLYRGDSRCIDAFVEKVSQKINPKVIKKSIKSDFLIMRMKKDIVLIFPGCPHIAIVCEIRETFEEISLDPDGFFDLVFVEDKFHWPKNAA